MRKVCIFLVAIALLGFPWATGGAEAQVVTLTPISTGFNSLIGIDHHEPTNQVIVSVNYPSGSPYNFELVASDGTRTQFSAVTGLTDEVKIATAKDDGGGVSLGGFTPGELFVGTGLAGEIARISADGTTIQDPWVILPGETGLMRGSLYVDRTGVFGGDLIAVTTAGGVWRIDSSGTPTKLTTITTHLEGVTTVPNDPAKYGPWAGKILIGAENQALFYTVDTSGTAAAFNVAGIRPEDIDIIPPNQNFFGVDFAGATLWGAPPSEFASMVGDILVAQESPGLLFHVRWDGSAFVATQIAAVPQWEHVTFSTAGIKEIPPVGASNHYLGYTVRPIDGDDSVPVVRLTDQFGEGVFKVAKKSVVHYNPVDKNEEGISNPEVHQVGYALLRTEGTDSPHTVDVTNQFGAITVTTANAERLLVPSTKTLGTSDGLPRELENGKLPEEVENHFLCYGLTSFDGFSPLEVTVADQFKDTRPFSVLRPIALCNPVTKEVQGEDGSFGEPEEPVNAKNHLLCYGGGVKTRDRFEPIRFETNNQLGFDFWEARRDAGVLCVPSEKKEGKEPFCGDGNLDPGEECDDGNNVEGDGCSATCEDEKIQ